MATLAGGAFITSINGKRCTAVPKAGASTRANVNFETKAATTTATTDDNVAQFTAAVSTATSSQDESSTSTSTTISTSLSITTSITVVTSEPPPPPQVQASVQVAPVALEPTPDLAPAPAPPETSPATTSSIPTFTQIDTPQSPPPPPQPETAQTTLSSAIIQTSQTDNLNTATAAPTAADTTENAAAAFTQQDTALPEITSSPPLPDTAAPLFTTIGTPPGPSNSAAADATGSSSSTNGAVVSAVPIANNNSAIQSTVAVAGGVIGGVLLISMIAFFGWWWRRRIVKKRRSTLLTPLTMDNTFGPDEKGAYVINRGSIGPTPRVERFKSAVGYNMKKINGSISRIMNRRGSTSPSVNMDRGNSQFIEPNAMNNRSRSSSAASRMLPEVTAKDRLTHWWTRLTADMRFNWRLKKSKNPNGDDIFGSPRGMNEKTAGGNGNGNPRPPTGTTPAFLTLLGMDDRELDREAQRRRMDPSRQQGGSASSSDRFLGGLNLNFGGSGSSDDPFSDANAIAHISAKPAPLVVSQSGNPFSDVNAVVPSGPKRGTYVAEMRRSRGQSVTAADRRPPSSAVGYRESGASVESFGTRRNKFRSDPFDLERPELLGRAGSSMSSSAAATVGSSGNSRISGGVGTGDVRRPAGAHTRADSFTSKYSSGISMGDWSDPGPDVGPAAARGGGGSWEGPEQRESPTQGWRNRLERESVARQERAERRTSGGSQGSVGKAM
ncbi:hypothetical protein GE09DRAFT_512167 [Coniochaeta sp. 2T2.1]|nr:hypothetical protein GE09DRAFT_512167 [Coniochaeta sp. 2T2.1]